MRIKVHVYLFISIICKPGGASGYF
jgi:hypothetical protein